MSNTAQKNGIFAWIAGAIAGLLMAPLITTQLGDDWDWQLSDYIVMGCMLFVMASLCVIVMRHFPKKQFLVLLAFIVLTLYIWAELAVGIFTNIGS